MTDEELEMLIAAHGKDVLEPLDPRWERWTLGELSAEEERELLEGADPALVEMFRPLDASVARQVTER
ncbi:MAG: hypothetical protein KC621_30930, partial [Myxococcales bacterium]|nr:hypothetical protein [Myxococcales bacterium]